MALDSASSVGGVTFEIAVLFVDSSLKGRKIAWRTDPFSIRLYRIYYSGWYRLAISTVALLHMALTLFEPATTLRSYPAMPPGLISGLGIEVAILACYVADIVVRIRFMGWRQFVGAWNLAELVSTAAFALDIAIQIAGRGSVLQFSRFLRPVFLISRRKHVRFIFTGIARTLPGQIPALALILGSILAFAISAPLLLGRGVSPAFAHLPDARQPFPPHCSAFSEGACDAYFHSLGESFYNLFVLMTRTNWPVGALRACSGVLLASTLHGSFRILYAVMLPYYAVSQWSGMFFAVFLLFTQFFIFRLLLAIAATDFAAHSRAQVSRRQRHSQAALRGAFALLLSTDTTPGVDLSTFAALAMRVRPRIPPEVIRIVFHACGGGLGRLSSDAFVVAASLLEVSAVRLQPPAADVSGLVMRVRIAIAQAMMDIRFALARDVAIIALAACGIAVAHGHDHTHHGGVSLLNTPTKIIAVVGLALLLIEAIVKVVALGPTRYWGIIRPTFNRLDVLAIALGSASVALDASGLETVPGLLILRAILSVRVSIVLLRELQRISSFAEVTRSVYDVMPLFWRTTLVIGITLYSLAVIGMEFLGGVLLRSGGVGDGAAVAASAYGMAGQWVLNLNSFSEALMTCFAILVNTQAPLLMEGAMAGLNSWGPAWYFLLVYVVTVCIISNVCIALVMQAYVSIVANVRRRLTGHVELWEHLLAAAEAELHAIDPQAFPYARSWNFKRSSAFIALNEALFGRALALQFLESAPSKSAAYVYGTKLNEDPQRLLADSLQLCFPRSFVRWLCDSSLGAVPNGPVLSVSSLRVFSSVSGGAASAGGERIGSAGLPMPGVSTRLLTDFVRSELVSADNDSTTAMLRGNVASSHVVRQTTGTATDMSAIERTTAAALCSERAYRLQCIDRLKSALAAEQRALDRLDRSSGSQESGSRTLPQSPQRFGVNLTAGSRLLPPRFMVSPPVHDSESRQPLLVVSTHTINDTIPRTRSRSVDSSTHSPILSAAPSVVDFLRSRLLLVDRASGLATRRLSSTRRSGEQAAISLLTSSASDIELSARGRATESTALLHPRQDRADSDIQTGLSASPLLLPQRMLGRDDSRADFGSADGGDSAAHLEHGRKAFVRIDSSGLLFLADTPESQE